MKKVIALLTAVLLVSTVLMAQTSNKGIKYQAIARDFSGQVLMDQDISIRVSIIIGEQSGSTKFSEIHRPASLGRRIWLVATGGRASYGLWRSGGFVHRFGLRNEFVRGSRIYFVSGLRFGNRGPSPIQATLARKGSAR